MRINALIKKKWRDRENMMAHRCASMRYHIILFCAWMRIDALLCALMRVQARGRFSFPPVFNTKNLFQNKLLCWIIDSSVLLQHLLLHSYLLLLICF